MKNIIEKQLKEEIFSDEYEYFFSSLTDRFEHATELWKKELEKKFNKKFKPIWIMSAKQNKLFMQNKENYIILNKKLKELKKDPSNKNVVYLQDSEDLNKELSESEFISDLIKKITEKQGRIFILGFTSSFLNIDNPKAIILGPNPDIATKFDNKAEHLKLFNELKVPRNKSKIYNSKEELKKETKYPFFISAPYSSGGHENKFIFHEKDLDKFFTNLREVNKKGPYIVSQLLTNIDSSPNVNAIITKEGKTKIICITDQILNKNEYIGNIYPSKISKESEKIIVRTTKTLGDHLSKEGFRGLFGLDFIVNSTGQVYTIDLNPRRQGGYLCNILMSKKINIPELELRVVLGEEVPNFFEENFKTDFYWGHIKIKEKGKINEIFRKGNINNPFENIGSEFSCIFYPKESYVTGTRGYRVFSEFDYNSCVNKLGQPLLS